MDARQTDPQVAIDAVFRRHRTRESIEELMHHQDYTPGELADLLGLSIHVIRHEVRTGALKATFLNRHILTIQRDDVIDWLRQRG